MFPTHPDDQYWHLNLASDLSLLLLPGLSVLVLLHVGEHAAVVVDRGSQGPGLGEGVLVGLYHVRREGTLGDSSLGWWGKG